jgi:hypothetical protein
VRVLSQFRRSETGSEVIEFGLVLLPLLGFLFLIMDIAWICFAQSSLQHAVQVGVRAAASGYVPAGTAHQDAYLKNIVQQNAMGFLAGDDGMNAISIAYYDPANLSKSLSGTGSNAGGNVIEISIKNVSVSTLGPLFREDWAKVYMKASSSDVMEGSRGTSAPPR